MSEQATALVIEDEPQIVRAVVRALGESFDRVLDAGTAADGIDQAATARPDRAYVAMLRRKIERDPMRPTLIFTEPGVGYRFAAL